MTYQDAVTQVLAFKRLSHHEQRIRWPEIMSAFKIVFDASPNVRDFHGTVGGLVLGGGHLWVMAGKPLEGHIPPDEAACP